LQGVAGAGLIPLSQATLLQINPPERHGHAIMGPIMGPALGGWLTYDYSWRWVFYINLPVGVLCTLGILVFIRHTRNMHREPFDFRTADFGAAVALERGLSVIDLVSGGTASSAESSIGNLIWEIPLNSHTQGGASAPSGQVKGAPSAAIGPSRCRPIEWLVLPTVVTVRLP
jgi:MFS family permease